MSGRGGGGEAAERAAVERKARPTASDKPGDKIMAAALKMLAARARSEEQLRERLTAKGWADAQTVERCIERLKELGYVNDNLFAQSFASSRVSLRPVGRSRLARELAGKKVSRDVIEGALDAVFDEVGEEALIDRAIEKRIRTHGRPADRGGAKRFFDHLARLGFEYGLIVRKMRALKAEIEETVDEG